MPAGGVGADDAIERSAVKALVHPCFVSLSTVNVYVALLPCVTGEGVCEPKLTVPIHGGAGGASSNVVEAVLPVEGSVAVTA